MAGQITGSFTMSIDGDPYDVTDGVLTPGGWEVTQVRAGQRNAGNRRVRVFPKFTGNIPRTAGISIAALAELKQAEITIEDDIGGVWQMFGTDANSPTGEIDEATGMIKLDLVGDELLPVNE